MGCHAPSWSEPKSRRGADPVTKGSCARPPASYGGTPARWASSTMGMLAVGGRCRRYAGEYRSISPKTRYRCFCTKDILEAAVLKATTLPNPTVRFREPLTIHG